VQPAEWKACVSVVCPLHISIPRSPPPLNPSSTRLFLKQIALKISCTLLAFAISIAIAQHVVVAVIPLNYFRSQLTAKSWDKRNAKSEEFFRFCAFAIKS